MAPQTASSSIDQFLLDLVIEKHGEPLEDELKHQMVEELKPRLTKWVTLNAMTEIAKVSPDDVKTLKDMSDAQGNDKEIEDFIQSKIPDMTTFLAKTLLSFRQTYMAIQ